MAREEIGKKIKALRISRGYTQDQLAEHLGYKRSTISNYEIGRRNPSLPELQRIAKFLNVNLDYFGIEEEKNVYDLIARAKMVFEDDEIPAVEKAKVYKEIMRLYLKMDE